MKNQPLKKVEPNLLMKNQPLKKVGQNPIQILTMFDFSLPIKRDAPIPNQFIKKVEQMKNATEFQKYCQIEFQKSIQKITENAKKKRHCPEEKMRKQVEEFWNRKGALVDL
jgi:reverse gyrase